MAGHQVRTLTSSVGRASPFGDRVEAFPFNWDHPERLTETLRGAAVLYNTYWVRFNSRQFQHAAAVAHTRTLFAAARAAEVGRVVHISIMNPSEDSPFEYFRGKAQLERALAETGLPHAILRPGVLFGGADILINNIAWLLRRLPVFGVFGDGEYRVQPIHVDDLAALAVEHGANTGNALVNAIGPETFAYRDLVRQIGEIIGVRRPILSLPPALGYFVGWLIGRINGDVLITRDEIGGLMANLLYVDAPPTGTTRLTAWARAHRDTLGRRYASELARRRDRRAAYETL
jgi:NADH dehydrogenase